MDPVASTATRLLQLHAAEVWNWFWIALFPVLVTTIVAVTQRRGLRGKGPYALPTAARIVGYPALFVLLVAIPLVVIETYVVPVLLDAHPASRPSVTMLLAPVDFVSTNGFVWITAAELLWPIWVVATALHSARRLRRAPTTH